MIDLLGDAPVRVVMILALLLLCVVAAPLLAARKGYKWYLWIFAGSALGFIILAFLPFANKPEQSREEQQRLQSTGNRVGGVLTAISIGLTVLRIFLTLAIVKGRSS